MLMRFSRIAARVCQAVSVWQVAGCASLPPEEEVPSAERYYTRALEVLDGRSVLLFFHDVDYPRAIELFQEVIDNYPYSQYATLAELKIADVYFDTQKYEEAASYYQDFVELHPKHADVPYAIYQNGLCSFAQIREPDQDQGPTLDTVAQFEVLLQRYPNSDDAPAAREKLQMARNQLALHDIEIADFYLSRGNYYAAQKRYTEALTEFPDHTLHLETLSKLADALTELQRIHEARQILLRLIAASPEGDLRESAFERVEALDLDPVYGDAVPAGAPCNGYLDPDCGDPGSGAWSEIPCDGLLEPGCVPAETTPALRGSHSRPSLEFD